MGADPEILHALLSFLEDSLVTYICHQIDCGAQVVQLFDSWAHHLSPSQFLTFSLPYSNRVVERVRRLRPGVPLILHANGGAGKLTQMAEGWVADVAGLDWNTDMGEARKVLGPKRVLQVGGAPLPPLLTYRLVVAGLG